MPFTVDVARVRPARVLVVTSAAAFLAGLDLFIVNVAFRDIGRDFHGVALSELSWVLNGYAIVYAALLVPLGRLADRTSRKAGFLAGLALFTAASAVCAAAPGIGILVAARVVQAVGAAALTPTSLGLLLAVFPPERRARAVRIWPASGALAAAAGPVVGGLLVQASWRWVFLVNVPVGVLAIAATVALVPDSRDPNRGPVPDLIGAVLAAVSVGALALALVQGTDRGWGSVRILGALVAAPLGSALFWARNRRHPVPVVEPGLLRVSSFAWSNAAALAFSTAFAASLLAARLAAWRDPQWPVLWERSRLSGLRPRMTQRATLRRGPGSGGVMAGRSWARSVPAIRAAERPAMTRPPTICSPKRTGDAHNGAVTVIVPRMSSSASATLSIRRLLAAAILPVVLAVGCTPASTGDSPSPSSGAGSNQSPLTGAACESPRRSPDDALEGTVEAGELWALGGEPRVAENFKLVVRATGSGKLRAVAMSPTGVRHAPTAVVEHSISNFNRPGDEWGLFFTFDRPGCWQIHLRRTGLQGFFALRVQRT